MLSMGGRPAAVAWESAGSTPASAQYVAHLHPMGYMSELAAVCSLLLAVPLAVNRHRLSHDQTCMAVHAWRSVDGWLNGPVGDVQQAVQRGPTHGGGQQAARHEGVCADAALEQRVLATSHRVCAQGYMH